MYIIVVNSDFILMSWFIADSIINILFSLLYSNVEVYSLSYYFIIRYDLLCCCDSIYWIFNLKLFIYFIHILLFICTKASIFDENYFKCGDLGGDNINYTSKKNIMSLHDLPLLLLQISDAWRLQTSRTWISNSYVTILTITQIIFIALQFSFIFESSSRFVDLFGEVLFMVMSCAKCLNILLCQKKIMKIESILKTAIFKPANEDETVIHRNYMQFFV